MAISSDQIALNSSTAVVIVAAANSNTVYDGYGNPRNVQLTNVDGSNDAYIGTSTVSSAHGYKLTHGSSINLTLAAGDAIYGIAAASTPTIHFIATDT